MKFIAFKTIALLLFSFALFTQNAFAQQDKKSKKKVEIVTKTIDENGEEKVTKIVREGEEVNEEEMEKLLKEHSGESKTMDVTVEMGEDGQEKIIIKETGKDGKVIKRKIVTQGQQVEVEGDGGDEIIFLSEDGEVTEFKEKDIKIIRRKSGENIQIEVEDKIEGEPGMMWKEDDGAGKGDVIIIEEEITEELDKDGKTVKKTVKKRKTIKKGEGQ